MYVSAGVCMYVSGKCMYPPHTTKTNNLYFPKKKIDPKWLRGKSMFVAFFVTFCFWVSQ